VQRFRGLGGNVHGSSMARWKACGPLPISANWTFIASSYGWGTINGYWSKSFSKGGGSFWAQISAGMGGCPPKTVGVRKLVPGLSRNFV